MAQHWGSLSRLGQRVARLVLRLEVRMAMVIEAPKRAVVTMVEKYIVDSRGPMYWLSVCGNLRRELEPVREWMW